jgi:uncharacterized protein YggE
MKIRFFAALLLCGLAVPAAAQTAPRSLTMSGQGTAMAAPDTVTLSSGVISEAPTAAAALAANNTNMQAVLAALAKLGVAPRDMQTENFSVSPQYAGSNDGQPQRLTGYRVANEVTVRLDDVSKLGTVLDALVSAGANQMNGINFTIRDSAALLTEARKQAVADATAKARTYADAAGVTLGPILSISESDTGGARPLYMAAPMLRAAKSVPVAMGEESLSANVSIVWEIR